METRAPVLPLVHYNGTSRDELRRQVDNVVDALIRALDTLSFAAPHLRDYYPLPEADQDRAMADHAARLAALRSVLDDYRVLQDHLYAED